MKILAFEHELPGATAAQFRQYADEEACKVLEYQQAGFIDEVYFRTDINESVLVLECISVVKARRILAALPFVKANLIKFEFLPLKAYSGFERQFVRS